MRNNILADTNKHITHIIGTNLTVFVSLTIVVSLGSQVAIP